MKPLQQLANRFAENRINHIHFKNKSSQSNGPINAYCKLKERSFTTNSCLPQYTGWKTNKFTIKINNSDNCVKIKNGSLVLLENIATSKTDNNKILVIQCDVPTSNHYDHRRPRTKVIFDRYRARSR